jgi:protein O-GlcNAc transferase
LVWRDYRFRSSGNTADTPQPSSFKPVKKNEGEPLISLNPEQPLEIRGKLQLATTTLSQQALFDPRPNEYRRQGDALVQQGRRDEAASMYARALSIKPDTHEVINALGALLYEAGRVEQAVVLYKKAIALQPNYAEAHNNLGLAQQHLARLPEAIASYIRSLRYNPYLAAAHCNLGGALVACGDFEQAMESLRRALELQPKLAEAYLNLGNAYKSQGLLTEAATCYEQAISHASNPASAFNNLAETYKEQGKLDKALASYRKAINAKPDNPSAYSNLLYFYAFTRHVTPEQEKLEAQSWEKSVLSDEERAAARKRASVASGVFAARPRKGRRIRLGIVSAELGSHAVAQFLLPLLAQLDRKRFHLTLFPTQRRSCARAQEFQTLADNYVSLAELSDGVAADRIRFEQIDVLMDTTAHTFGSRLGIFARRAAPVQCTYIGYWSTTGLTEMDWFFADSHFPGWMEAHFTEKIWRLPRLFHCYNGEHSLPESRWAPDPEGAIWLGSFNRLSKIREQTLALWAKVLYELPQANLLFEDGAPYEEETHRRILATLADYGIPEYRVAFIPFAPGHERHMALYDRLDIALDTVPFNSGTTAFDALWMGVPLVALDGSWLGARLTASVLKACDRPEWVAQNEEEYVSIVSNLARDVEGRTQQRKRQRARMMVSPLCDANGMARAMEDAIEGMYDQWMAPLGTQFALRTSLSQLPLRHAERATGLQLRG